jgi:hypothetical protein
MNYQDIDRVLLPWSKRHGLHVLTSYREDEVRYIDVVDDAGNRYEMSISPHEVPGLVRISIWDRKRRSKGYRAEPPKLEEVLEKAYSAIMVWVQQAGNTRTPVL